MEKYPSQRLILAISIAAAGGVLLYLRNTRRRKQLTGPAGIHDDISRASIRLGKRTITVPAVLATTTIAHYHRLSFLGAGAFGKVLLVRSKRRRRRGSGLYAMKVLNKEAVVKRNQVLHTLHELHVLAAVRHPFICRMHHLFEADGCLCMVMDLLPGGELYALLKKHKRLPLECARFYAAEVAVAVGHLHSLNIIYRAVKPEDLLLDAAGHLRLCDFGLTKGSITTLDAAHTFCGTPEYMAPEVVRNVGHGKPVDWWALGILIYEMLVGLPPFFPGGGRDLPKMFRAILHADLRFPSRLAEEYAARSLLQLLLARDPRERLGSGAADVRELERHEFFAKLHFHRVVRREYAPPYIPEVDEELGVCCANFELSNPQFATAVVGELSSGLV